MTSRGDNAPPGARPPPKRIMITVPAVFRLETGEETRVVATLPLDTVLRAIN